MDEILCSHNGSGNHSVYPSLHFPSVIPQIILDLQQLFLNMEIVKIDAVMSEMVLLFYVYTHG